MHQPMRWLMYIVVLIGFAACRPEDSGSRQTLVNANATDAAAERTLEAAYTARADQWSGSQATRDAQMQDLNASLRRTGQDTLVLTPVMLLFLLVAAVLGYFNYHRWKTEIIKKTDAFKKESEQAKKDRPPADWWNKMQ
ncbi:MAG: hypothetical protein JNM70_03970 [Anaerolineae bacterium]|nr:hypothetical protein [Anaerolineae bacterium]